MRSQPWLCLDGVELSNGVRVLTYLRRGLAGPDFTIPLLHTCADEISDVYLDEYTDYYPEIDPMEIVDNSCLACYCHALDELSYLSPELDPAPWYVSTNPASAEFLGFYASDITLDSPLFRNVASRASGGGVVTQQQIRHRTIAATGYLYASSTRGMAYGERWLYDALQGASCSDDSELTILPSCMPEGSTEDEEDEAFRTLRQVGLIEGPVFERPVEKECSMQAVSLQFAAGVPYLHAPAEQIMDLPIQADPECVTYDTPEWAGDAAMVIRIGYGPDNSNSASCRVTIRAIHPDADCDTSDASACIEFNVTSISRDEHLLIDGVNKRVSLYDNTLKQYISGWNRISFEGLFQWPLIDPCTTACICVERTSDLADYPTATIDVYRREI